MSSPRLRRALLALFLVPAISFSVASSAEADSAPFKDPNAVGLIGFCDKNGSPVTSGHIRDVPFVTKYVSSTPAPKEYVGKFQKAAIYAFSPLPYTNPGDWVGYQMTASSGYTNLKAPMALATLADPPLEWHVTSFPPQMDGLVQLRMILSNVNTPPRTNQYSQAIIRVKGDSWTLVTGVTDKALCQAGLAKSAEQVMLPPTKLPSAPPTWAANASPNPGQSASQGGSNPESTTSSDSSGASPTATTSSSQGSNGAVSPAPSAAEASAQTPVGSGSSMLPWLLGLGAVVVGGGAFVGWWRTTKGESSH